MLLENSKITQGMIEKLTGSPTSAESLANALNTLDPNRTRVWEGGGLDIPAGISRTQVVEALNQTGPWAAMMNNPGNIPHFVIVDGFDNAGNLMIRDPWEATKYSMEPNEFLNYFMDYVVYSK